MSEQLFREVSPEAPELQPILTGLFGEYTARYGAFFTSQKEVELTEWYLPPRGLFIVLERDGELSACRWRSTPSAPPTSPCAPPRTSCGATTTAS